MFEFDNDMATDVCEITGYYSDSYDDWVENQTGDDDYYDDCFLEALDEDEY